MRRLLVLAASLALLVRSPAAHAQQDDAATAFSLFEQGRQMVAQGNFDAACPKLAESARLVPKVSTLLNLADCYERAGRLASAWARYAEAGAMAHQLGQTERETLAHDRGAALEPRLPRITLVAPAPVPGLVIKRDGVEAGAGVLGTAVPVDPGKHTVEASAPGRKAWSTTVDLAADTPATTVTIPALADDAPPATGAALRVAPAPAPAAPKTPPASGSTLRTTGIVVGAAGVVGLGIGGVFGGLALSKKSQADSSGCTGNQCSPTAGPVRDEARSDAGIATVGFVAGGVLAAGGVALWLLAPRQAESVHVTPSVGAGTAGLVVGGAW